MIDETRIRNLIHTLRLPIVTAPDRETKLAEESVCRQCATDLEVTLNEIERLQEQLRMAREALQVIAYADDNTYPPDFIRRAKESLAAIESTLPAQPYPAEDNPEEE